MKNNILMILCACAVFGITATPICARRSYKIAEQGELFGESNIDEKGYRSEQGPLGDESFAEALNVEDGATSRAIKTKTAGVADKKLLYPYGAKKIISHFENRYKSRDVKKALNEADKKERAENSSRQSLKLGDYFYLVKSIARRWRDVADHINNMVYDKDYRGLDRATRIKDLETLRKVISPVFESSDITDLQNESLSFIPPLMPDDLATALPLEKILELKESLLDAVDAGEAYVQKMGTQYADALENNTSTGKKVRKTQKLWTKILTSINKGIVNTLKEAANLPNKNAEYVGAHREAIDAVERLARQRRA